MLEIEKRISEEQNIDVQAKELDRQAQVAVPVIHLKPLSMSSRLQDPTEPADSFPEQPEDAPGEMEQPMVPPPGLTSIPGHMNQLTAGLIG